MFVATSRVPTIALSSRNVELPLAGTSTTALYLHFVLVSKVGDWLDARDSDGTWCVAQVVRIEGETMRVHFQGYSSRCDEDIRVESSKVRTAERRSPEGTLLRDCQSCVAQGIRSPHSTTVLCGARARLQEMGIAWCLYLEARDVVDVRRGSSRWASEAMHVSRHRQHKDCLSLILSSSMKYVLCVDHDVSFCGRQSTLVPTGVRMHPCLIKPIS